MSFDWNFLSEIFPKMLEVGLPLTLKITFSSFLIGILIAILINLIYFNKPKGLYQFTRFYVSFFRGTPVILHLYLVFYFFPLFIENMASAIGLEFIGANIPPVTLAIIALSMNISSYMSETIRSAVAKLNQGEIEAAIVFGLPTSVIVRRIVFPQILRLTIPNLSTQIINVLQGSSLAFYITVQELTGTARILAQNNWKYYEVFIASGIIYWGVTIVIEHVTQWIENRLDITWKIGRNKKKQEVADYG